MKIRRVLLKTTGVIFFIFFGIPFFMGMTHSKHTPKGPYDNSQEIKCDGVHFHYRHWAPDTASKKPWCLLIHGFSGSTYTWRYTVPALTGAGYHVVAVDIPPYGYSDRNPKLNSSFSARADLLYAFMNTFSDTIRWHVVGHSMGGGIAQAIGILYPEKIVSITFAAGALFSKLEQASTMVPFYLRLLPVERFLAVVGEEFFITSKRVHRLLASAYGQEPQPEDSEMYLRALQVPGTSLAIVKSMTRSRETKTFEASQLHLPALAIWGDQDTWVPLSFSKKALDEMPDVQLEMIQGSAHCPMETHHKIFNSILIGFLDSQTE